MPHFSAQSTPNPQSAHSRLFFDELPKTVASLSARLELLTAVSKLFERNTFLSFQRIQDFTGLSLSAVIKLKLPLEEHMRREITSRIDLSDPGFYLED